jgi:hypothetical protein
MELPPVLELITSEIPPNKLNIDDIRRLLKDKGFLREISVQARFSVQGKFSSGAESSITDAGLNICPTAALNPLSHAGKCNAHNCRVIQAESFARSIGLYCDHAVLTDYITPLFLAPNLSRIDPAIVVGNVRALTVLMPMVRAGIIRFSDPLDNMCLNCCRRITVDLSENLWHLILKDGKAECFAADGGKLKYVVSSSLFDTDGQSSKMVYELKVEEAKKVPAISRKIKLTNLPKETISLLKKKMTHDLLIDIYLVSEEAKSTADKAAVLVTNSRKDSVILRKIDSGSFSKSFDDWESLRSVQLPWVSNLSVEEIIQLRERASKALPKFRDRMNKELFSISATTNEPDKLSLQVVKNLREDANELEAELSSAVIKTGHTGHLAIGTTGISCIVYGIGAKDPTAIQVGATALTTALAAMYHPSKNAHADHAQLKTKPAYVLLSAREIIRNRKK